jgi:hypothetical protein
MKGRMFGLGRNQLADLLRVGLESEPSATDRDRIVACVLEAKLASELPLDVSVADSLPAVLGRPCDGLGGYRGRSTVEVLLDPQVDVSALTVLKDYAKELVRRSRSEVTTSVATVLYYAAIASAIVFHDSKITQHGYRQLERSFAELAREPWLTADLQALIAGARQICAMKDRVSREKTPQE